MSRIDSDADRIMLVYEHKVGTRKLVPNGVSLLSEFDIMMVMSANEDIHVVTKTIRPGQTSFDLFKRDLKTPAELEAEAKSAQVENKNEVPWKVFLGHEWEGHSFSELTILTPDPSKKDFAIIPEEKPGEGEGGLVGGGGSGSSSSSASISAPETGAAAELAAEAAKA